MATVETLPPLELPGHVPSVPGANAEHPMRVMTRRAAGLAGPVWDARAASEVAGLFDSLAPQWHSRESADRRAIVDDALGRGLDRLLESGDRAGSPGTAWDRATGVAVEVGSGLGTYSAAVAERFGVSLAVELSAEMHRRAHRSGAYRVLADGAHLPVGDASVDAVVLVNCFLFPAEVERVLRPGGVLVWVNSSGTSTPIHLSTTEVTEALGFEVTGIEAAAGIGTWCVLRRAHMPPEHGWLEERP